MKKYTLEEAKSLEKENHALIDTLRPLFDVPARAALKANPFGDVPKNLQKISRVLDKAWKRQERRRELRADIQWPNRWGANSHMRNPHA